MADRYFVGDTDSSWNDASNWSATSGGGGGAGIPTASDDVFFDVYSPDCNIDVAANALSIDSTGYTNTLTQDATYTLTVAGAVTWAAGTFTGGDSTIDVGGVFTLSGGSFTSTSGEWQQGEALTFTGGTFAHNNGTLVIDTGFVGRTITANAQTFYKVEVDSAFSVITWADTMKVENEWRVTDASSIRATGGVYVECIGTCAAVSTEAGLGSGNTLLTKFTGSGAQTLNAAGGTGEFGAIEVAKSGAQLTMTDTIGVEDWTLTSGSVTATGSTLIVAGGSPTVDDSTTVFNNVTFSAGAAFTTTIVGTMIVNGTMLISVVGTINGGTLDCRGNVTTNDATVSGTCAITLTGTAAQNIDTNAGAGRFPNGTFTVNKASGTATLSNGQLALDGTGQDLVITSGTLDLSSSGMNIDDAVTVNGGVLTMGSAVVTTGGLFTLSSGTCNLNSSSWQCSGGITVSGGTWNEGTRQIVFKATQSINIGANKIDSARVDGSGSITLTTTGTLDFNQGLTLNATPSAVILNGGTWTVRASINTNQTNATGTTALTMDDNQDVALVGNGSLPNLTINKTGGKVDIYNTITMLGDWTHTAGTVNALSSTIKFRVTSAISASGMSFNNVTFDGKTFANYTFTITGTLDVNGNLLFGVSGDTLTLNGGTITAAGNVTSQEVSCNGTTAITLNGSGAQNIATGGTGFFPDGLFTINKSAGTATLSSGALNLNGTGQGLTVTSGTLKLDGNNLTVNGTFDVDAILNLRGTETITTGSTDVDATASTVIYEGAGTATLDSLTQAYYNLTLGASKTHQITAGVGNGISVAGALASNGASGTKSILVSATPSTQWELNLSGTSSLTDNVNVTDSDASAGNEVTAIGSTDGGNNDNWLFVGTSRYFVGDTDDDWNDASNWAAVSGGAGGAGVPDATLDVFFDANSPNCGIDVNANCQSLDSTGYTNTLTQEAGFTLTVATGGDLDWVAGTFAGGNSAITVNDNLTVSGGSFTSTGGTLTIGDDFTISGGTWAHNSGTIALTGNKAHTWNIGTETLWNVTLNVGNVTDIVMGSDIDIDGTLTVADFRRINGAYSMKVSGNVSLSSDTFGAIGGAWLEFDGTGAQAVSGDTETRPLASVKINKASGTLTFQNGVTLSNDWEDVTGTVDWNGKTLTLGGGAHSINAANTTFYNVAISMGTYALTVTGTWSVSNDLAITAMGGFTGGGTIDVKGNTSSADVDCAPTVTLTGTGTQTIDGPGSIGKITINKPSGEVTFNSSFTAHTNFTNTSATTINEGTATLNCIGSAFALNTGGEDLYGLQYTLSYSYSLLTVTGSQVLKGPLIMTKGRFNGTLLVEGDVSGAANADGGTGAITLQGTNAQSIDCASIGEMPNGTFTVNKASGTATLASALVLNVAAQDLVISSGTLDLAGYDLTVNDKLDVDAGLKLTGTETLTIGTKEIDATSSTITYAGAGTAVLDALTQTYYNLVLGAGKTHQVTAGVGNGIQVDGTLSAGGAGAVLRSTSDGTQWELNLQGTSSLGGNVDVKDSDATAGNQVSAIGSTDSGNNDNWLFATPSAGGDLGSFGAGNRFVFGIGSPFAGFGVNRD